jgi:hypothetical protein
VASGCGTDHLDLDEVKTVDEVIRGYETQMEAIEALGGKLIVMASRALARVAQSPADYERVYDRVLRRPSSPWCCTGWATCSTRRWLVTGARRNVDAAMDTALGIIAGAPQQGGRHQDFLLDKDKEIAMRRRLPATGGADGHGRAHVHRRRFQLRRADCRRRLWQQQPLHGQSDALLGIFDAIAPAASAALGALAQGNVDQSSTPSWAPRCRCRATSLPRPRAFTKPAWSSWPGSTATKATSPWWVASKARARWCTLPSCSAWPTPPTCLKKPELAVQRMKTLLALHGVEG